MRKRKTVYVDATLDNLNTSNGRLRMELCNTAEECLHRAMLSVGDLTTQKKFTVDTHSRMLKDELFTVFTVLNKLRMMERIFK